MRIGETQNLKLSITPTEAQDDANVTWTSDRPEILSVDETGKVTAHQSGSATITATADSVQGKLTISVQPGLTGILLKPQKMELHVGESAGIEADPVPADADLEGLTWNSSDESVAYYKDGTIYAAVRERKNYGIGWFGICGVRCACCHRWRHNDYSQSGFFGNGK